MQHKTLDWSHICSDIILNDCCQYLCFIVYLTCSPTIVKNIPSGVYTALTCSPTAVKTTTWLVLLKQCCLIHHLAEFK
jgi:hypothetical protein